MWVNFSAVMAQGVPTARGNLFMGTFCEFLDMPHATTNKRTGNTNRLRGGTGRCGSSQGGLHLRGTYNLRSERLHVIGCGQTLVPWILGSSAGGGFCERPDREARTGGPGFRFSPAVPKLWVPLDKNEGPCQAKSVLDDVEASLSVTVSLRTKTLSIFT